MRRCGILTETNTAQATRFAPTYVILLLELRYYLGVESILSRIDGKERPR